MTGKKEMISSGITRLDTLLGGGFLKRNTILMEGTPGTGKTTFALQFLMRGVESGEAGMLVTFEQSFEKLNRDASSFGWNLQEAIDRKLLKIIYTSPKVFLKELQSPEGALQNDIVELGISRLAIDGLAPIRLSIGDSGQLYRESILTMLETLGRLTLTTVITNELSETPILGQSNIAHEQFLCDTLITLRQDPTAGGFTQRSLEIAKSRGQRIISGRHTIELTDAGIELYPRAQVPEHIAIDQMAPSEVLSIGVLEVDEMLGGGIYKGSVTLCVGLTGTGKSVLSTHFSLEGISKGERVLYVTLDEHSNQLVRNAKSLNLDVQKYLEDGSLFYKYVSPLELDLNRHCFEVLDHIEKYDISRLVIDSISAYQPSQGQEMHDFIYALVTHLKNRGVTTLLVYENPEMIGVSQISEDFKVSPIVDNIILLSYVEIANRLRRAITIPKSRGLDPTRVTREFTIKPGGIHVLESGSDKNSVPQLPFDAYLGILGRSPQRLSPQFMDQMASSTVNNGGNAKRDG